MSKTALITGASSGIGKEMSRIHAGKGGDLILVARREDKLNELKQEVEAQFGVSASVIAADLNDPAAPERIFEAIKSNGLQVDYLINNAGFGALGKYHEQDWTTNQSMIQVNIMALSHLTRLFLPDMVARNSGRILNVSSTASFTPGPLQAVYYASKAYVTFFSNALAEELHDTNITVTALMPGATETEFGATSGMDQTGMFARPVSAKSVAQDGYDAMLAGKLDMLSGLSFSRKLQLALLPFIGKKTRLSMIRKMQEVDA